MKGDTKCMVNYQIVSRSICGKVFERLYLIRSLIFLKKSKLLSSNQSGFGLKDLSKNKLLSFLHSIMWILIRVFHLKYGQTFLVFQKPLTKFNMKDYYVNFNRG